MKPLLSSLNLLEIHHCKNVLQAAGIRCWIRNELLSRLAGEIPFMECTPELHLIDEADRWLAEKLIDALRSLPSSDNPAWRCLTCGETLEGQFSACWRCSAPRAD